LSAAPDPLAAIGGCLLLRGGKGRKGTKSGREGRGEEGGKEGRARHVCVPINKKLPLHPCV